MHLVTDSTSQDIPKLTIDHIKAAEEVIGMSFTPQEREQMLDALNARLPQIESLWKINLPNSVAMPLVFQPMVSDPNPPPVPRTYPMGAQDSVSRPDHLEDLAFYPVTKLAELIRTRQVTSTELTEMYLARLKRYNPILQCVVTFTEELAWNQAQKADEEIAQGYYRGPLHGIPWGVKDLFATREYKTTWGAMPYKDQMIDMDSTVVQRLEEAGAVLIAKLTTGALAYGDIWFDGVTKNPWDITEGSSGSSAGPGSATAAGCVGFAIGTETHGSIISPSTRCGVSGLRPTFGRVSRYGAMALVWSMDKIGPMCRSVEDCALVFSAIYGPDGHDMSISPQPFTWNPALNPRKLRVGYIASAFQSAKVGESDSDDVLEALTPMEIANRNNSENVLAVMREQEFDLIPLELPDYDVQPLFMILLAEAAAAFDEITRTNSDDTMQWQEDQAWPNSFRAARFITAIEYIQGNRIRMKIMQEMAQIMQEIDVFVVPSFGGNVLMITNMTGHPAVVVPNGFTDKHTPTSITFIGGLYKENETLAVAKAFQDATDYHLQYPSMNFDSLGVSHP